MGRDQLAALARIIEQQAALGVDNPIIGAWSIRWDGDTQLFYFDKCEFGTYCEERPTIIDVHGALVDRGGPILTE